MILQAVGSSSLCLPSQDTVQQLFSAARDAGVVPDISLDPVLTAFLSTESRASLLHQYAVLQRGMAPEQLSAFRGNVTGELGGASRVQHGGVGVVALALSMLFDLVARQVRGQQETPVCLFGIRRASRIGRILHGFLRQTPGVANDGERMAETTELYDQRLKLELIDHYERMTNKKRMSTEAMRQWLAGAAFHLHMRIHQVRLESVPPGSAESLRLAYRTAFSQLVQDYGSYLRRNVRETPPSGPGGGQNLEAEASQPLNPNGAERGPRGGRAAGAAVCAEGPAAAASPLAPCPEGPRGGTPTGAVRNSTTLMNLGATPTRTANEVTGPVGPEEMDTEVSGTVEGAAAAALRGAGGGREGLLVIEAQRNVSHAVRHHACESPVIEQALASLLLDAQDLEESRDFFLYPPPLFSQLLAQRADFDLKIRWRKRV